MASELRSWSTAFRVSLLYLFRFANGLFIQLKREADFLSRYVEILLNARPIPTRYDPLDTRCMPTMSG